MALQIEVPPIPESKTPMGWLLFIATKLLIYTNASKKNCSNQKKGAVKV
jgi:hypothetical protein